MILLTKFLGAIASPIMLITILLCLSLITCRKKPRFSQLALVCGVLTFLVFSSPKVANALLYSLERKFPPLAMEDIARHDAIVLLAGGLEIPKSPRRYSELGSRGDRLLLAFRLFEADKAPLIIITGGNVFDTAGLKSEADYSAGILQEWGVPPDRILTESTSRNTRQSVVSTASLLEEQAIDSLLLVTSAYHMPRTVQLFEPVAEMVTPASANHLIVDADDAHPVSWLPSATSLEGSSLAVHEYLGMLFNYFSPVSRQMR